MLENLPKTYNPKEFEDKLYKFWNENNYFTPKVNKNKKPFTIMMPPPNVTGSLHMGHALNSSIQDVLTRWKRMDGFEALWLPGTDHASISTEAKVVEKLRSEGKTKEELGRDGFLEEAWDWTNIYGGRIKNQLKKLGVSCDWSRDRFTLDESMNKAVEEVFVRLYDKGLIYRGDRIINWCPSCKTAISDAEVEHEDTNGFIWHVRYPIKNSDLFIEIATTRPETILGDLAVAVNPEDERYKHLVGKIAILPLVGREIPIIADSYVEMEFGTGAVKITPSHDPNDFEVGERYNLGQLIVISEDGSINENGGKYNGLDRFEARKKIIEDLAEKGYLVAAKEHQNAVGHCERCHTIIEPLISKQWFVKMGPLAKPALEAFKNGELNFIPDRFAKIYIHWLENIRDWCISRQLWWGHRLPVYYCQDCDEVIVSRESVSTCPKCNSHNIVQDTDTLDTWFSSALWPFSTLGWPDNTDDLNYFFPTNVLVTGYDIIFFWVIRMVFSSIEQIGEVPFKDVFITGLVRDSQGRKMSKSLGNGIDPLDVIDEYGADALRFTLLTGNSPGNDMRFYTEKVESNRNFANKIWNAARFVLMNMDENTTDKLIMENLEAEDKWIISKLNNVIEEVSQNLEKYEIGIAAQRIYDFIWDEYCDWYIEMVKSRLYCADELRKRTAESVLLYVLKDILKILHPYMPFITEEIWQGLPNVEEPLIITQWPKYNEILNFKDAENEIEYLKLAIKSIRNARAEMKIIPSKKANILFITDDEEIKTVIENGERYFKNLASADMIKIIDNKDEVVGEDYVSIILDRAEAFLPLKELIDFDKEIERLEKEKEKLEAEINRVVKKLSNEGFVVKAPTKIIDEEKEKQKKYEEMLEKVVERLNSFSNLR